MSNADAAILNDLLAQLKAEQDPTSTDSEFWEFFSATQILKDFPLDPEEIRSGIVGQESNKEDSGSDGGIDSMFVIVNNKLIRDIDQARELTSLKSDVRMDVILIQSKKGRGFGLGVLNRWSNTCESIFRMDKRIEDFPEKYNEQLLNLIECFREAHKAVLIKFPEIHVSLFYVGTGDSQGTPELITAKARELEEKVKELMLSVTQCTVSPVGARDIYQLYHKPRKCSFHLKCVDSMPDRKGGFIALVELSDYYDLITDNGQLREYLFESNVRDYEGDVDVNAQIRSTLQSPQSDVNFWWLNNGVTIIANRVLNSPPEIVLESPQIVNGLQTSQEIFQVLKKATGRDQRHTVIRIIESPEDLLQDKIIRATNSQTKIPPQYLRASDDLQRDIERFFKLNKLHYDRRKNSWRKHAIKISQVVGMTELAQSVASIVLCEPDHARARPSRYFKDTEYNKLFKETHSPRLYLSCALLRKRVEVHLREVEEDKKDRNNLLFYVMSALPAIFRKNGHSGMSWIELDVGKLPREYFSEALALVRPLYTELGATDKAAKGKELLTKLKPLLKSIKIKRTKKSPLET